MFSPKPQYERELHNMGNALYMYKHVDIGLVVIVIVIIISKLQSATQKPRAGHQLIHERCVKS